MQITSHVIMILGINELKTNVQFAILVENLQLKLQLTQIGSSTNSSSTWSKVNSQLQAL